MVCDTILVIHVYAGKIALFDILERVTMKKRVLCIALFCLANAGAAAAKDEGKEYIKGFIAGATLTDETIVRRLELSDTEWSSFEERAFRTRLGRRDRSQPATYYAEFCLPASKSVDTIASEVLDSIKEKPLKPDVVYKALKTLYPCAAVAQSVK